MADTNVFSFPVSADNVGCVNIAILNDLDYEGDHTFQIMFIDLPVGKKRLTGVFTIPEGPVIGMMSTTTVEIHDAEGIVLIQLQVYVYMF